MKMPSHRRRRGGKFAELNRKWHKTIPGGQSAFPEVGCCRRATPLKFLLWYCWWRHVRHRRCLRKPNLRNNPPRSNSPIHLSEFSPSFPFGKRRPRLAALSTAGCKLPSTGVLDILKVWSLAQGYLRSSEKFGGSSPGKSTFQVFSRSGIPSDSQTNPPLKVAFPHRKWKPGLRLGIWKSLNSICWWNIGCERYDKDSHSTLAICVRDGGKGFPKSVWKSLYPDNLDCLTLLEPQILTLISISTQTEGSLE